MKRLPCIGLFLIVHLQITAQTSIDSSRFKLGYSIIDIISTTISLEGNIELAPYIDAYIAGGYTIKFSRKVPNASENILNGYYFQLGPRFKIKNMRKREVLYIVVPAFGYTSFNHFVTLNYDYYYGTYTETLSEKGYALSVLMQIGAVINLSKKFQMDFGFQLSLMGSPSGNLTAIYYTPGLGYSLVSVQNGVNAQGTNGLISPKLTLKYRFDFRK